MKITFDRDSNEIALSAERQGEKWHVTLPNGEASVIAIERTEDSIIRIRMDDRTINVPLAIKDGTVLLSYEGVSYSFDRAGTRKKTGHAHQSSGQMVAPMVGLVTSVLVEDGQPVEPFQPILVIEAMKVLATLEAPFAGRIKLHVDKGHQVEHGQPLAEVVPLNEAQDVGTP